MSRLNSYFYDIESLTNAFTLSCYRPDDQRVDIYYLVDDPALNDKDSLDFKKAAARRIREKNQNFKGKIYYYNLRTSSASARLSRNTAAGRARPAEDGRSPAAGRWN